MTLRSEIGESPAVVERVLRSGVAPLRTLADQIGGMGIEAVGTSR